MSPAAAIDAPRLPRLAQGAEFVPLEELGGRPHIVVDGIPVEGTVLSLSHRPGGGVPRNLADDTSALIVDRYLREGAGGIAVDAVTNDHYDEDGLFGAWLLLEAPPEGSPERALAIEASEAGDFKTWRDPWAPRVAIASMAMAERHLTPFPEVGRILATSRGRDPAGRLYRAILPRTAALLADPERYRLLWSGEWGVVEADMALIDAGEVALSEEPAADLAIVRTPRRLHPMALYPRTPRMRVLTALPDGTMVLEHRYETWVEYASRPLAPRVELHALAAEMQRRETRPGRWVWDGADAIMPRLWLDGRADGTPGPAPSSIAPEELVAGLVEAVAGP